MARAGPEKKIQKKVCDYAAKRAVLVIRRQVGPFGSNGWPDVQFIYASRSLFLEFKALGKWPTELQYERIIELRAHGVAAFYADDVDEGIKMINKLIEGLL